MRRDIKGIQNNHGRLFAAVLALALSCGLFAVSPLQAGWGDDEYGDIFNKRSTSKSAKKSNAATSAGHVVKPLMAPTVQRDVIRAGNTREAVKSAGVYAYSDANSPDHLLASPRGSSPMHNETISSALGHYRAVSKGVWLKQVYESNGSDPIWHRRGRVRGDANAAIQLLSEADTHGLNPAEYHVEEILSAKQNGDLTRFDLLLTDNVLHYVSHVRDGQYRPKDVDSNWLIHRGARPDLAAGMAQAVKGKSVARFMKQASPKHSYYYSLRRELIDYTTIANSGGWPSFPSRGRGLKPGMSGSDVKKLRARLAVTDGADLYVPQPSQYDQNLKSAVEHFQRRHGLTEDGVVGGGTRVALAVPVKERISQLSAAMERWRWLPDHMGKRHIIINVPAFRLWYRENGVDRLTMKTIVGKTKGELQTPSFANDMTYMVLNPDWNVPNSIISEEMAPKAHKDPGYFEKRGYTVLDEAGNVVDPRTVNWGQFGKNNKAPYKVLQTRGGDGALGKVAFIFPNEHNIALHDTQSTQLFQEDTRAFSHGCIRVEKPVELGARLLSNRSPGQFSTLVEQSSQSKVVDLPQDVPVYVVYMTAWADDHRVYFYDDLYRRDKRLVQTKSAKRG